MSRLIATRRHIVKHTNERENSNCVTYIKIITVVFYEFQIFELIWLKNQDHANSDQTASDHVILNQAKSG